MTLFFAALFAQTWNTIPVSITIDVPIERCEPGLTTEPDLPGFAFSVVPWSPKIEEYGAYPSQHVRLITKCQRTKIYYWVECMSSPLGLSTMILVDNPNGIVPGSIEYVSFRPWNPAFPGPGMYEVNCEIRWVPCSNGDMDGDCNVNKADVLALSSSRATLTLDIFASIQNDWMTFRGERQ